MVRMENRFKMLLLIFLCSLTLSAAFVDKFKAAVVTHEEMTATLNSTDKAMEFMMLSLDRLEVSVKEASRQGSALVVFPEYGITGSMNPFRKGRPTVYPYAIDVPEAGTLIPHLNLNKSINSVVVRLASMAERYQLYIIANLIERVNCTSEETEPPCPADGHFQYNTNLVFAKNRTLIRKYHKLHRWEEENERLDPAPHPEYVWFDTEFGRVGVLICYDTMFIQPGIKLVEKYQVDHIAFSTYWGIEHAFLFSSPVQFTFGFARRMNVNYLMSNEHNGTAYLWGSLIATPHVILNSTYEQSKKPVGKVITATLNSKIPAVQPKPSACSTELFALGESKLINLQDLEMNVTKLNGFAGKTRVCYEKLCCNVKFERNYTKDLFILVAFTGVIPAYDPDYLCELCMVTKCHNDSLSSCDTRDDSSHSLFTTFEMHAQFQSDYISPSWTAAGHVYNGVEWDFTYDKKCNMISASKTGLPMLSATMFGFQ